VKSAKEKEKKMIKQTASRWILASLAALVMTAGATLGAAAASSVSLPGDLLYNVKRAAEQVELASAPTVQTRVQLEQQFSQRRQDEVRALVSQEREAEAEFSGTLQAASGQMWVIDDMQVTLDPAVSVLGNPVIGQRVIVQARTLPNGQVRVFRVEAGPAEDDGTPKGSSLAGLKFESPLLSPSPEASQTPEASETPESEHSPEPSETPEPPHITKTPESAKQEPSEASDTPEAHQTLEPNHTPEPTRAPEVHIPEPAHGPEVHAPEPQHTPEATSSHPNDGKTDNGREHGGSSGNGGEKDSGGNSGDHGGND
jgi:uncharacterized membrane protein YgcG